MSQQAASHNSMNPQKRFRAQEFRGHVQQSINHVVSRAFIAFISRLPFYLFGRTSRLRTVVVPDRIDKGHWSWYLQVTRPSVAPIMLLRMYDTAIVPCLLVFLILKLDDGRGLDCALLEKIETLTTLRLWSVCCLSIIDGEYLRMR